MSIFSKECAFDRSNSEASQPPNEDVGEPGSACSIRVSTGDFERIERIERIVRKPKRCKFFVFNDQQQFESHPLRQHKSFIFNSLLGRAGSRGQSRATNHSSSVISRRQVPDGWMSEL